MKREGSGPLVRGTNQISGSRRSGSVSRCHGSGTLVSRGCWTLGTPGNILKYTVCNKASVRVLYCTYVAKRQKLAINRKMYFSVEACAKCGIAFVGEEETSGGAVKLHILDSRTGISLSPGSTYYTVTQHTNMIQVKSLFS
jgi:hypothetical protein